MALGYNTVVGSSTEVRTYMFKTDDKYVRGVEIDLHGTEDGVHRSGYLCMSAELARTIGLALIEQAATADALNTVRADA